MTTYRTFEQLLDLKCQMDMANISEEDRAVILDETEYWKNRFSSLKLVNHHSDRDVAPSMLLGFRIIWRTVETIKKESYKL